METFPSASDMAIKSHHSLVDNSGIISSILDKFIQGVQTHSLEGLTNLTLDTNEIDPIILRTIFNFLRYKGYSIVYNDMGDYTISWKDNVCEYPQDSELNGSTWATKVPGADEALAITKGIWQRNVETILGKLKEEFAASLKVGSYQHETKLLISCVPEVEKQITDFLSSKSYRVCRNFNHNDTLINHIISWK